MRRIFWGTSFSIIIAISSAAELRAADTAPSAATVAQAVAKEEAGRIETKAGGPNQIYDATKLEATRRILASVQQDSQLVALRNQLAQLNAKPRQDSGEERVRLEEALAAREKELVLERQPGLRQFIEAREKLQKEMKQTMETRNAPPETLKALAEEIKAREAAAKKKQ